MNARGIDHSSLNATAASEPKTTSVKTMSLSWNSGAMSTPPRPASIMERIQAIADVRASLMPRSPASSRRSTTARIERPARVRRSTNQSTRRGERGRDEHRELVAVERDAEHVVDLARAGPDAPCVARGLRVGCRREPEIEHDVADGLGEPLHEVRQRDQETDRADDARVHRGRGETPQQDPVEQQPEQRREDEHREDQRGDPVHPLAGVELEVEVADRERDRAVGEVEDARRLVREHEARRHHRVDGARDRARDDQVEEAVHGPGDLAKRLDGCRSTERGGAAAGCRPPLPPQRLVST